MASTPDESLARNKERGWRELGVIDEALLRGEIDEDGWHARVLDVIEPAYLAAETPQGQSGRSGDAAGWEHARRLLLDAVPDGSDVLDVGCANGLLMESLVAWAAEDGRDGLDRTASRSPPDSPTSRARGCRTGPTASGPATR